MRSAASQFHRRGFTFVELLIGLVVTTIVVCALAAFTFGVSESWGRGDDSQSVYLAGTMAVERLTAIIRPAATVLQSTGPTCLIWAGDANTDGSISFQSPLQVRFDQPSQTIFVDRAFPQAWTAGQVAQYDQTIPAASMTPALITNSPYYTASALIRNVANCQFLPIASADGIQAPTIEIVLTVNSANPNVPAQTAYSTVTLRASNSNPQ